MHLESSSFTPTNTEREHSVTFTFAEISFMVIPSTGDNFVIMASIYFVSSSL